MEEKEGDVLEGQLSFLLTYIFFFLFYPWINSVHVSDGEKGRRHQ